MTSDAWPERIWQELRRIADALEAFVPAQTQEPEEAPGCPHPEERRVSFGVTLSGQEEWECTQCRTRFPTPLP